MKNLKKSILLMLLLVSCAVVVGQNYQTTIFFENTMVQLAKNDKELYHYGVTYLIPKTILHPNFLHLYHKDRQKIVHKPSQSIASDINDPIIRLMQSNQMAFIGLKSDKSLVWDIGLGEDVFSSQDWQWFFQSGPVLVADGVVQVSATNADYMYYAGLGVNNDGQLLYISNEQPMTLFTFANLFLVKKCVFALVLNADSQPVVHTTLRRKAL